MLFGRILYCHCIGIPSSLIDAAANWADAARITASKRQLLCLPAPWSATVRM